MAQDKKTLQDEVIEQVKISHAWMLKDIKMRTDNLGNPGNYTDELQHAIEVQKLLDMV